MIVSLYKKGKAERRKKGENRRVEFVNDSELVGEHISSSSDWEQEQIHPKMYIQYAFKLRFRIESGAFTWM